MMSVVWPPQITRFRLHPFRLRAQFSTSSNSLDLVLHPQLPSSLGYRIALTTLLSRTLSFWNRDSSGPSIVRDTTALTDHGSSRKPLPFSIQDSSGFPALRYNDGDVIVKISQRPSECLLLHSSVLKAAMPQLAPAFAARWGQGDAVEHPVTGAQFTVYTLALKGVEETVLLEGKVRSVLAAIY